MAIHYKKVGGLHFIRIGRINLSFSKSRKSFSTLDRLTRDAVHADWDRRVSRFEDMVCTPFNPVRTVGCLLALVVWTLILCEFTFDSVTLAQTIYHLTY